VTFGLTFNYDVRDDLRRGAVAIPNSVGGSFTVLTLTPEIAYRLPRGFTARLRAPVHRKTFDETSPEVHVEKTGLGDLEFLGSYDLLHGREAHAPTRLRLSVTAGAALPTGKHEVQPFVGDVAPTPLQLGAGTLDPIVGIAGQYAPRDGWAIDVSGATRLAIMETMHDYRPASVLELAFGGHWRPWPGRLGLDLHVEWSHLTKVAVAGVEAPNTGRDGIYLAPGGNVTIGRGLALGVTARIPVYLRVNEAQFTEDFLLAVRVAYTTPSLF
jgi:hypothetical protein